MAVPKHRTSKARKRMRRAHYKAVAPSLAKCSHCHQPKPAHAVCPNCGYYGGREIVKPKEKEE
ncbi:MAG: 50S ribosomal protein L32 [Candidatus Krumholzibacteria bacterium]|nr:50S ribosomal protein L32 [Candidatus Krumholzibacteria bacterium]